MLSLGALPHLLPHTYICVFFGGTCECIFVYKRSLFADKTATVSLCPKTSTYLLFVAALCSV